MKYGSAQVSTDGQAQKEAISNVQRLTVKKEFKQNSFFLIPEVVHQQGRFWCPKSAF